MPEPSVLIDEPDFAVVDKPAGLSVHPGAGRPDGTLLDWLAANVPETGSLERHGLVHRLDKDTSGALLVAKTPEAAAALSKQFKDRSVQKTYLALVRGVPAEPAAELDAPIARHHADRKKFAVRPDGKESLTAYEVAETPPGYALLEVRPKTGRTHQIRVHLAALGNPIVGDATYGSTERGPGRQFLHAAKLTFKHPRTGKSVTVSAPLPEDLESFLREVRGG
ncbi:MAG TPA: RluA family pseudouridine synthase [Patescibacteria group bacterium]|jgi:23S rRNA pseudouridine1911/1915/1917 synthase